MDEAPNQYLKDAILTAPPEQLQLMLYDGAIRFIRQGLKGLESRQWDQSFEGFSRAQKIVIELLNSLNYEVDRALCTQMASLYNFVYRKLLDASVQRDPKPATEALGLIEYQRQTWLLLLDKLRQERAGAELQAARPRQDFAEVPSYGSLSVQG